MGRQVYNPQKGQWDELSPMDMPLVRTGSQVNPMIFAAFVSDSVNSLHAAVSISISISIFIA